MNDRLEKLNNGGYNNLLVILLIVGVIYLFVTGFTKSKQQAYLSSAGTDKNVQLAQGLKDAFNRSGLPFLADVDFTDVELCMKIAAEITDFQAVADAYRVLYNSELATDLQKELTRDELQRFYNIVYKRTGTPATGGKGTVSPSLVGKAVTAIQTVNLRLTEPPYGVEKNWLGDNKQAKKGEYIGMYVDEKDLSVTGKSERFVRVKVPAFLGFSLSEYYVHKASVKIA